MRAASTLSFEPSTADSASIRADSAREQASAKINGYFVLSSARIEVRQYVL